jgi:hypothetical protein
MVEQALTVRRESPERPLTGAVFQGQGEPLSNYDSVIRAARVLRDPAGARIGSDRITISTVGLVPQIERYTAEGHPYRLILSLTSAFSEKRARLVPIAARHGVPELAAAPAPSAAAPAAPGDLRLQAIAERDGHPVALINDRLVREGDSFDGVTVVRIGTAEVEVEVRGQRRVLRF